MKASVDSSGLCNWVPCQLPKFLRFAAGFFIERSKNTILLASTQAVYKTLHSTVRRELERVRGELAES